MAPRPGVARLLGLGAIALCLVLWWIFTAGATPETRMISPVVLPSPGEVLRSLPSLLTERALLESVEATLRRVLTGFALAILVGVPLGILAGSYRAFEAALAPIARLGPVPAARPAAVVAAASGIFILDYFSTYILG